jgi:hypothetical protein
VTEASVVGAAARGWSEVAEPPVVDAHPARAMMPAAAANPMSIVFNV